MHICHSSVRTLVCHVTIVAVVLGPAPLTAGDQPAPLTTNTIDIRLAQDNSITINFLNADGTPASPQAVALLHGRHVIATATSNSAGRVSISGLRPGPHVLVVGRQSQGIRLWRPTLAPPHAIAFPAITVSQREVRGQFQGPGMLEPALIGTGIATAALIAVLVGKSKAKNRQPVPASP